MCKAHYFCVHSRYTEQVVRKHHFLYPCPFHCRVHRPPWGLCDMCRVLQLTLPHRCPADPDLGLALQWALTPQFLHPPPEPLPRQGCIDRQQKVLGGRLGLGASEANTRGGGTGPSDASTPTQSPARNEVNLRRSVKFRPARHILHLLPHPLTPWGSLLRLQGPTQMSLPL